MRRVVIFGGVILGLVALALVTTLFMRGGEVIVYPKFKDVIVQATFTASTEPAVGSLGYELLTLEETGERTVTATGKEEVEERATGEITIYNAHSTTPQRLIKNTRFESADGKVFRINDSVVVPGYTEQGGNKVPGTLTTSVFADGVGEGYNVAPGRFTVPGLDGTSQFETIYAESSAPMQGGFVGEKLIVSDTELTAAQTAIRDELRTQLLARLTNERPAGFTLYEESVRVRYESLPSVDAGDSQATIRERAVLEVPIFRDGDFAGYIAANTVAGYENEPVRLENPYTLAFAYKMASSSTSTSTLNFDLSGDARIIWDFDENQLREDVAGVAKTAVPSILAKYPAIGRAETVLKPFWKGSFPEDPRDIKITEVLTTGE